MARHRGLPVARHRSAGIIAQAQGVRSAAVLRRPAVAGRAALPLTPEEAGDRGVAARLPVDHAGIDGRLRRLGLGATTIIVVSAVLRGTYHLYQGFGGFLGNVIMGLVFGWIYQRTGRVLPLVIAHWVLDIVSFAGYPLALAWWPELFGVAA